LGIPLNMRLLRLVVAAACVAATLLVSAATAQAAKVALFDDPAFVDTAGGSGAEADTLHASLVARGHTVKAFTGITSAAWSRGLAGQQLLVIPELEIADLAPALSQGAEHTLRSYVATGGGIITFDRTARTLPLLNGLFGFDLASSAGAGPYPIEGGLGGTNYVGGPASLPDFSATNPISRASFPGGGKAVYANGDDVAVALFSVGSGHAAYMAWDWFDAQPVGANNGGWLSVLNRTVKEVAGSGCTVSGSGGADTLIGTAGKDRICGFGANDVIQARGAADIVFAGKGNDDVFGEGGNDRLFLEAGNDEGRGGAGNDYINGGKGNDSCSQNAGHGRLVSC
jgi:Ca2+-binding RTX toxin-like protein